MFWLLYRKGQLIQAGDFETELEFLSDLSRHLPFTNYYREVMGGLLQIQLIQALTADDPLFIKELSPTLDKTDHDAKIRRLEDLLKNPVDLGHDHVPFVDLAELISAKLYPKKFIVVDTMESEVKRLEKLAKALTASKNEEEITKWFLLSKFSQRIHEEYPMLSAEVLRIVNFVKLLKRSSAAMKEFYGY